MHQYPDFATLLNTYLARSDERSAAWLARRLQVHPSTVTKWLNGDSRPRSPERVIQIADILGIHQPAERQALLHLAGYSYIAPNQVAVPGPASPQPDLTAPAAWAHRLHRWWAMRFGWFKTWSR